MAAITSIAEKFGVHKETLRNWVRRAEVDGGIRPGLTSDELKRIKELEIAPSTYYDRTKRVPCARAVRDPLPYDSGVPAQSTYGYAESRPTVLVDPSGQRGAGLSAWALPSPATAQTASAADKYGDDWMKVGRMDPGVLRGVGEVGDSLVVRNSCQSTPSRSCPELYNAWGFGKWGWRHVRASAGSVSWDEIQFVLVWGEARKHGSAPNQWIVEGYTDDYCVCNSRAAGSTWTGRLRVIVYVARISRYTQEEVGLIHAYWIPR